MRQRYIGFLVDAEVSLQGTLKQFISKCLSRLPYWLPKKSYTEFNEIKKNSIPTIQQRQALGQEILYFLESMKMQLKDKDSEITRSCQELQKLLINFEISKNKWLLLQSYQKLTSEFEAKSNHFFKLIDKAKSKSLNDLTLYDMKQDDFAVLCHDFRRAKYIQHQIHALEKLLFGQPDNIIHFDEPKPLLDADWLGKRDYADLVFLLSIILPKYLNDCLEQKVFIYQKKLEALQNQVKKLITLWGDQTTAITRLYRILRFYQLWQIELEQRLNKLERKHSDWTTEFTFLRLFTYEKKDFFTEVLKKENALLLFSELTSFVDSKPDFKDPQKILHYLRDEKQAIKTKLDDNKNRILSKYPFWGKIPIFFGLALTEHPTYKFGKIGFDLLLDMQIETFEPEPTQALNDKIDEWGNQFVPTWIQDLNPKRATQIVQNSAGLVCYLVDQSLSSWVGYSHRVIHAIHRTLFSQFDAWVNLGSTLGLDEIALLEKEMTMHYLLGLGIFLFLQLLQGSDNWMPIFFSYMIATVLSLVATIFFDEWIKNGKEWDPKEIAFGKFIIQQSIFSKAYSSSLNTTVEFLQPTKGLTPASALKTMGFYAQPSKCELQERFHELALENHPDKYLSQCSKAEDRLACIESYKSKMEEINNAYSILKR